MHLPASRFAWAAAAAFVASFSGDLMAQGAPSSKVEQGRYLARAGDCTGCHTTQGGEPFAGGLPIPTPFGVIYSSNITPDADTGIGGWSEQDFYGAMHRGIGDEGKHLYPAFPYPWFTKLSRVDVDAIRAYLGTLTPVRQKNRAPELPWPVSWRASVGAWNALYFHEGELQPDPGKSAAWNRGAYLVEGAGHCGACHTPKNLLGGDRHDAKFQGGDARDHWYAPSLTSDLREGIGGWSAAEIVEYLKTGSNAKSASAGSMTDVIKNSTQYLSDGDLNAIATFLKDVPAGASKGAAADAAPDAAAQSRGAALYVDNCAACHLADGAGMPGVFPPLRGSAAVQSTGADTVIHVVVAGDKTAETKAKTTGLAMPSFAGKMTDQDIADVVNYVRNAWGNVAPVATAGDVAAIRKVAAPGRDATGGVDRLAAERVAQPR